MFYMLQKLDIRITLVNEISSFSLAKHNVVQIVFIVVIIICLSLFCFFLFSNPVFLWNIGI